MIYPTCAPDETGRRCAEHGLPIYPDHARCAAGKPSPIEIACASCECVFAVVASPARDQTDRGWFYPSCGDVMGEEGQTIADEMAKGADDGGT